MILRPVSLSDAPALARLGRESFCAKFAHLYRPEDLQAFLDETYSESAVAQEIADPALVHRITQDGEGAPPSAFVKLRDPGSYGEYSDARRPITLCQLYTAPDRTGEGLGAALMDWAIAEARRRSADAMNLSVYSDNPEAQRFYARYGFAKIADIFFMVGSHRDDEFLLELRLQPQS